MLRVTRKKGFANLCGIPGMMSYFLSLFWIDKINVQCKFYLSQQKGMMENNYCSLKYFFPPDEDQIYFFCV